MLEEIKVLLEVEESLKDVLTPYLSSYKTCPFMVLTFQRKFGGIEVMPMASGLSKVVTSESATKDSLRFILEMARRPEIYAILRLAPVYRDRRKVLLNLFSKDSKYNLEKNMSLIVTDYPQGSELKAKHQQSVLRSLTEYYLGKGFNPRESREKAREVSGQLEVNYFVNYISGLWEPSRALDPFTFQVHDE